MDLQDAINEFWHLDGAVTVLKCAGPYYILKPTTLADRDDLLHAGPWNIHGVLLLFLRPWLSDVQLHHLDFSTADMWVQMSGAPLEYMTPAMAARLGSLLGTVISIDRGTILQQNMEYMRVRVQIPIRRPFIPGAFLRVENGNPIWIQFGYERVFKACYNCGCVGHLNHRCPYSFTEAGYIIRNQIHEAAYVPDGAFWLAEGMPLYS